MSWQEFEDQEESREETTGGGGNNSSSNNLGYILIGIVLMLLAVFGLSKGGGSSSGGGNQTFDPAQTAYKLAQDAESYRSSNPYGGNYAKVVVVLVNSNGAIQGTYDHDPFPGHNPPSQHAEPSAIKWATQQLGSLQQQGALKGVTIHVVLFTQVRACATCTQSASGWAQSLDQGAGQHVAFSYWEIRYRSPSGFAPSDYPQGPQTSGGQHGYYPPPVSVRTQDLNEVYARP